MKKLELTQKNISDLLSLNGNDKSIDDYTYNNLGISPKSIKNVKITYGGGLPLTVNIDYEN